MLSVESITETNQPHEDLMVSNPSLEKQPLGGSLSSNELDLGLVAVGGVCLVVGGVVWLTGSLLNVQLFREIGLPVTAVGIVLTGSSLIAALS